MNNNFPLKKIIKKRKKAGQKTIRHSKFKSQLHKFRQIQKFFSSYVPHYDFNFISQNNFFIRNNRFPFKIRKVPSMFGFPHKVEESITQILGESVSNPLDVSVSQSKEFSGHYLEHKTISLSFNEFLNYEGPYNFYLAQFPLYEKRLPLNFSSRRDDNLYEIDQIREKDKLALYNLLPRDSTFEKICTNLKGDIHRINLWFSKKETFSQLHYDSYDNFLFMLKGKKTFILYPPNDNQVKCESVLTNSFQQSKLLGKSRRKLRVKLKDNEAIFVPQGWFHEVTSTGEGNIIAINIWFNSIEDISNDREKYLFRYLTAKLIENEIKELLIQYKKSLTNLSGQLQCWKICQSLELKDKAEYIMSLYRKPFEHLGLNLFLLVLFKISNYLLRTFILHMLDSDPNGLQRMFLKLDNCAVEFLTRKLEQVDMMPNSFEGSFSDDFVSRDEFYAKLEQSMNFQEVTTYFLACKKQLKERVLKTILFEKLSNSYEF